MVKFCNNVSKPSNFDRLLNLQDDSLHLPLGALVAKPTKRNRITWSCILGGKYVIVFKRLVVNCSAWNSLLEASELAVTYELIWALICSNVVRFCMYWREKEFDLKIGGNSNFEPIIASDSLEIQKWRPLFERKFVLRAVWIFSESCL